MTVPLVLLAAALALSAPRAGPDAARRLTALAARDPTDREGERARERQTAESVHPQPQIGAGADAGPEGGGRPVLVAIAGGLIAVALLGPSAIGCVVGVLVGVLCAAATRRLAAGRLRRLQDVEAADLPLFLDVVATQLRAGAPIGWALQRASPLAPASCRSVAREASAMLRLGAPPAEAWRAAAGTPLRDFAALARRSADNGAQLADQAVRLAADLRAGRIAAAESAARRAGVWAMAPLGLCFLPAFVCLGVVPVVLGLVGAALGGESMPSMPSVP